MQERGPAAFILDLDGFEGPIDLLLALAREQKVDLARISILELAEQYLAFIQRARDLRLEIAADYLVMAAWLTYLKSRLLLPAAPPGEEPAADELAGRLAAQLRHLDAIRRAADLMLARPRLGQSRFARPAPEGLRVVRERRYHLLLHELLQAYVDQRLRTRRHRMVLTPAPVMRIEDALRRICNLLGGPEWQSLLVFLPPGLIDDRQRRAALAASFAASLELAREGKVDLAQAGPFAPLYVRRRP